MTAIDEPHLDLERYCAVIEHRANAMVGLVSSAPDDDSRRRVERACDVLIAMLEQLLPARSLNMSDVHSIARMARAVVSRLRFGDVALPVTWLTDAAAPSAWARRLAHGTTMVVLDAADALEEVIEVDDELALDGVDELLICLLPRLHPLVLLQDEYGSCDPEQLTLEISSLADGVGWTVTADEQGMTTRRGAYGDAPREIEGSALELYRALWNRGPLPGGSDWLGTRWSRVRFTLDELRQRHPESLDERLARAYHFYAGVERARVVDDDLAEAVSWFEWSSSTIIDRTVAHVDVLPLLDELVAEGAGDSEFLSLLGAGPIEDVLRDPDACWSADIAAEIDDRVRRDPAWDEAVRSVWCLPEDVAHLPQGLRERVVELNPSPERVKARRRAQVPSRGERPRRRRR